MRYSFAAILIGIFLPFIAHATDPFVQTSFQNTNCSSCTMAFNPTNAGDTLVIYVTNGTDNGTDNFSSATWNGSSVTPTDKVVTGSIGGGDCVNFAPVYIFVIQNVSTGSQNFVVNWSGSKGTPISINEYTGVATAGQPAAHTFKCSISDLTMTTTVTSGDLLVSGGGIFSDYPTSCPAGWTFRTPTSCSSITQQGFNADTFATTTSAQAKWSGTSKNISGFLISLAVPAAVTAPTPVYDNGAIIF